jgi:hypothetical protein
MALGQVLFVLLNAHDNYNNGSVSQQASDYLKETCPFDDRWCHYKGRFELPVGCLW